MKKLVMMLSVCLVAACGTSQKVQTPAPAETESAHVAIDLVSKEAATSADLYEQLRFASEQGNVKEVKRLIKAGADVNQLKVREDFADYYETMPLMLASRKGHLEVVKVLIKAGANLDQIVLAAQRCFEPGDDFTALEVACGWDNMDVVMTLAKAGTNARSILYCACTTGNEELLKLALGKKAPLDTTYGQGFSPLMLAAGEGHNNIVQALIKAGADVNYNNDYFDHGAKYTALDAAKDHPDTVAILKAAGAKE